MRIGEYIKYKRLSLGYSQKELADRLGVSKQAVSKWETGLALPDVISIPDIASALKVKPEFLMKIIWTGETGEHIDYFIFVNVKEKKQPSYAIKVYSFSDFWYATKIFDEIRTGQIDALMEVLTDYYTHEPCRTFTVSLSEAVYHTYDEPPYKSLVIETRELNSLLRSHVESR